MTTEQIRRIFRTIDLIRLAFSIKKTVGKYIFTTLKDPVPQLKQSKLVHKIDWSVTTLESELSNSLTDLTEQKLTTCLTQYSVEQEHNIEWENPHILSLYKKMIS